jgi:hypothetical protein
MSKVSNRVTTSSGVVEYLVEAYEVDKEKARDLVHNHAAIINDAIDMASFNYYPGDKIATLAGLTPKEGYDPDAE